VGGALCCTSGWLVTIRWLLGLANVPRPVPKLLGQLVDHILEYDRVNVLAEQVEEEPVAHVALPDDRVYAFFFHTPVSNTKHKCPNIGAEDDDNAVDDDQAGEEPQEEKPKPDEDVDLFVDYIERENAESIVLFDVARGPKLVKCALCHPGEHVDHRVNPVFLVSIRKGHHFNSIGEESPVKKSVEEKHLTRDTQKSQEFTKEVSVGPEVVMLEIRVEIVDKKLFLQFFLHI